MKRIRNQVLLVLIGFLAIATIILVFTIYSVQPTLATLMTALVIGGLFLVIAAVLSLMITNMLARPIESLSKAAARIAAGDYSQKVQVHGISELEELAANLNLMSQLTRQRVEELAESQHKFKTIFDTASDSITIYDRSNLLLVEVNEVACQRLGYTREEMLKMSPKDFNTAENPNLVNERLQKIMLTGRLTFQTTHITKDGRQFPVEVNTSIITLQGRPMVLGISRDISERKQAEETLRQSEARFRVVFEKSSEAIGAMVDGLHVLINPAYVSMFGYIKADDLIGKPFIEFIAPAQREQAEDFTRRRVSGKTAPTSFETRALKKDGSQIDIDVRVSTYMLAGQLYTLVLLRDVTEQKRANQEIHMLNAELEQRVQERTRQLEASNKELEAFVYSVSHDLRAPLRAIDGYSRALLEDYGDELKNEARMYLGRVRTSTDRMGQLIDDLLNLSRVTRGDLGRRTVNLSQMAEKITQELRETRPERQVEWIIAPQVMAEGDPRLIDVVLSNLLGNAFKFTTRHPSARIEFGRQEQNGQPVYYVSDDGAGFDMAYAGKLFGVFQRLHNTEAFEGNGVGLALVQRIISRHGGRIWAESVIEQGTTFYFTLGEHTK